MPKPYRSLHQERKNSSTSVGSSSAVTTSASTAAATAEAAASSVLADATGSSNSGFLKASPPSSSGGGGGVSPGDDLPSVFAKNVSCRCRPYRSGCLVSQHLESPGWVDLVLESSIILLGQK